MDQTTDEKQTQDALEQGAPGDARPEDAVTEAQTPEPEEAAEPEQAAAPEPEEEAAAPDEAAEAPAAAADEAPAADAQAEALAAEEDAEAAEAAPAEAGAEAAEDEEAAEEEDAEPAKPSFADLPGDWYFVHTYAGYENKVKTNLETRIVSMNMEERIFEVVIPTEDVVEVKNGKKQVVQKKLFPGYLLVRMDIDDDSWYVVRNTPGVTGFVGSAAKPVPLTESEVEKILQRKEAEVATRPRLEHNVGDIVRVTTGPFASFQGVISDIDVDRSKLKVLVNIFGRETPVELGFDQVAKV